MRSHAYIRPSLGNALVIGSAGVARLLHSSVRFVSFRAPIDSVMDPGGRPRRPKDPAFVPSFRLWSVRGQKTRRLTSECCFNRSAAPHGSEEFLWNSKVRWSIQLRI